jgi:hypothetical protein
VSLYDPADASLFKLSRLRVPRYRQLFSTISYAVMLGLFLSVLIERSLDISALELVFWFWSAGYMLDEVVGFSEQGFGLYIISVWNSFDIGILLLFIGYYVLRIYGILMPDVEKKRIANMAYDVLASTAVLLFPRLFSVLDHYRYFSQLLIAFRMMAVDLAAVLVLIVISCSGFFVAFTYSFSDQDFTASSSAYALFQILMGFTPAAWEVWGSYNMLGKTLLGIFLIICHFLIVTILITVLTNSFMAVVQNANDEHQFLFAVNTISMVKSDALFSYIPPTNILGWCLSPLRFLIPFRWFVSLNRIIIKMTHIPMLLVIFLYERLVLQRGVLDPTDLVEQRGRKGSRAPAFSSLLGTGDVFGTGVRLREPSVTTFHKDRALEAVFRRPFQGPRMEREGPRTERDGPRTERDGNTTRRRESLLRTKSTTVVHDWMKGLAGAASPAEETRSVLERLETRTPMLRRRRTAHEIPTQQLPGARLVISEPEEAHEPFADFSYIYEDVEDMSMGDMPNHTDADGDDELATNDDEDVATVDLTGSSGIEVHESDKENERGYHFAPPGSKGPWRQPLTSLESAVEEDEEDDEQDDPRTPVAPRYGKQPCSPVSPKATSPPPERLSTQQRVDTSNKSRGQHVRTASSATILFAPLDPSRRSSSSQQSAAHGLASSPAKARVVRSSAEGSGGGRTGLASGSGTPRHQGRQNPGQSSTSEHAWGHMLPHRSNMRSTPNLTSFLGGGGGGDRRMPSFSAIALDLASDLGDNRTAPHADMLSASFGTQLEMAALAQRSRRSFRNLEVTSEDDGEEAGNDGDSPFGFPRRPQRGGEDSGRLNRLVLERMTNLEVGFRDILREVKSLSHSRGSTSVAGDNEANPGHT